MRTTRENAGDSPLGNDVLQVLSSGPYQVKVGDTLRVSWAVHVANTQQALLNSADSAYFNIFKEAPTGLTFAPAQALNVFPNPASDKLYITGLELLKRLIIRDLNGRPVLDIRTNETLIEADVSSLTVGMYVLEALFQDRIVHSLVVISR
jgi:hypothetical protein